MQRSPLVLDINFFLPLQSHIQDNLILFCRCLHTLAIYCWHPIFAPLSRSSPLSFTRRILAKLNALRPFAKHKDFGHLIELYYFYPFNCTRPKTLVVIIYLFFTRNQHLVLTHSLNSPIVNHLLLYTTTARLNTRNHGIICT